MPCNEFVLVCVTISIQVTSALPSFNTSDCYRTGRILERGQTRQVMASTLVTFPKDLG